jgi:hypothetical protein
VIRLVKCVAEAVTYRVHTRQPLSVMFDRGEEPSGVAAGARALLWEGQCQSPKEKPLAGFKLCLIIHHTPAPAASARTLPKGCRAESYGFDPSSKKATTLK